MSKIEKSVTSSKSTRAICLIKPHAVREELVEKICEMIKDAGLTVREGSRMRLGNIFAETLYKGHKGKDYFPWLVSQITNGEIVVFLVEGENAPRVMRDLAGKTAPESARVETPNSIRAILTRPDESFVRSRNEKRGVDNVVHTSNPDEEGAIKREGQLFFPCRFL